VEHKSDVREHRELKVLLCPSCADATKDTPVPDEDGEDVICRWCGDGAAEGVELVGCSDCPAGYCYDCVMRNFGSDQLEEPVNTKFARTPTLTRTHTHTRARAHTHTQTQTYTPTHTRVGVLLLFFVCCRALVVLYPAAIANNRDAKLRDEHCPSRYKLTQKAQTEPHFAG
jgi:hypothetical protein